MSISILFAPFIAIDYLVTTTINSVRLSSLQYINSIMMNYTKSTLKVRFMRMRSCQMLTELVVLVDFKAIYPRVFSPEYVIIEDFNFTRGRLYPR